MDSTLRREKVSLIGFSEEKRRGEDRRVWGRGGGRTDAPDGEGDTEPKSILNHAVGVEGCQEGEDNDKMGGSDNGRGVVVKLVSIIG